MTILVTAASGQLGPSSSTHCSRAAPARRPRREARDTRGSRGRGTRHPYRRARLPPPRDHRGRPRRRRHGAPHLGHRVRRAPAQHQNVIDAAKAAGAEARYERPQATTADYALGADHRATEEAIVASGVPAVIVRHNWYTENYAADVARAASTGTIAAPWATASWRAPPAPTTPRATPPCCSRTATWAGSTSSAATSRGTTRARHGRLGGRRAFGLVRR